MLRHIDKEADLAVRLEVIGALTTICIKGRNGKKVNEALDVLEQVALKTKAVKAPAAPKAEDDDAVVAAAISGLVKIIKARCGAF